MKYRNFRITWSVAWGVVTVLLCVLWVRSFWWHDFSAMPRANNLVMYAGSNDGIITFVDTYEENPPASWTLHTEPRVPQYENTTYGFDYSFDEFDKDISFPHWLAMLATIPIAGLPWIRWHYSLGTLLIATTLVALVLGFAAYSLRK